MSAPTLRPPPADAATPTSRSARQVWRAARGPVLIGTVLVAVAVTSVITQGRTPAGYLDPASPRPSGARALVQLLGDRGTTVHTVHTVRAARVAANPASVMVVTRPWMLSPQRLATLARLPGDRVLVEPGSHALRQLAPYVNQRGRQVPLRARRPRCDLPAARTAGTVDSGGKTYAIDRGSRARAARCYPAAGHPTLVRLGGDRSVTVLGTGEPLTNEHLDERGNAALALNLLGSWENVVWLSPEPSQATPAGDQQGTQGLLRLLPPAVKLAAAQLLIALIVLAVWRARRLGPVVAESLPAVVPAAETAEGRARLYRSRRARARAARELRSACLSRLSARLGHTVSDAREQAPPPPSTPTQLSARERAEKRTGNTVSDAREALVAAVAERTGRPATQVSSLLYGATPEDEAGLVRLADDLDALEREVR